jgi:hypothetical protein
MRAGQRITDINQALRRESGGNDGARSWLLCLRSAGHITLKGGMSWLTAIAVVLGGVAVLIYLAAAFYQTAYAGDILSQLRQQNTDLRRQRFGPEEPAASGAWHRVLSAEEQRIVWQGRGALLGLRQVALVEDERGRHWRVVVAHEKGKAPFIDAKELSGPSHKSGTSMTTRNRSGPPLNMSIDTDPRQQAAASPRRVVVRSSSRYIARTCIGDA